MVVSFKIHIIILSIVLSAWWTTDNARRLTPLDCVKSATLDSFFDFDWGFFHVAERAQVVVHSTTLRKDHICGPLSEHFLGDSGGVMRSFQTKAVVMGHVLLTLVTLVPFQSHLGKLLHPQLGIYDFRQLTYSLTHSPQVFGSFARR